MCEVTLDELLNLFLSDGFTLECLSKATDTSIECLENYLNRDDENYEFDFQLVCPQVFLMSMYYSDLFYDNWLVEFIEGVSRKYAIPKSALAKFLDLDENQFEIFIKNPDIYPNGSNLVRKIQFVLSLFNQDKRDYQFYGFDEKAKKGNYL